MFCGAYPGFFQLRVEPIQDDSQHDLTWTTDETNGSVIALFRECNNQQLSPWGWPFSCFPDHVTDLFKTSTMGSPLA